MTIEHGGALTTTTSASEMMPAALIACGADLVVLAERLYEALFRVAIGAGIAAGAIVLALWIVHPQGIYAGLTPWFAGLSLAGCGLMFPRSSSIYHALRVRPLGYAVPIGVTSAMLVVDGPYGPLWFVAIAAALASAGLVHNRRQIVALAVLATASDILGTLARGDALVPGGETGFAVSVAGLLIDGIAAYAFIQWLARFVIELRRLQPDAPLQRSGEAPEPPEPSIRSVSALIAPPSSSPGPTPTPTCSADSVLTVRQLEVLLLVRDGLRQSEIAAALGISVRQVERHLAEARTRTGCKTTAQIIGLLVADRLVPEPPEEPPDSSISNVS